MQKKETLLLYGQSSKVFTNIVILGNSITYAPESPGTEWTGPWGMAASAAEFDYVHLLITEFKKQAPSAEINIKNIAAFEREYNNYILDSNLVDLKNLKPDLLIIRIGENVQINPRDTEEFEKKYAALIAFFKENNPNVQVLGVGSIWINDTIDKIMARNSDFVPLKPLNSDFSNFAFGSFKDLGIQRHPSDKGMANISKVIWKKIQTLN